MTDRLRILIAATLGREAGQGGAEWAVMQYVLGLRQLGHDVCLVSEATEHRGFDAVINISGLLPAESIASIPRRVYLDLDPAFNQLWHEAGTDRGLNGHTHFVTVGQAIGKPGCDVPALGREWFGLLPPVVLDEWPVAADIATNAFTTIGNLRSYGSIERGGVHYGQKVHSLRRFAELPKRSAARCVLAMAFHPDESADHVRLSGGGWEFVDPVEVAGTPNAYRAFIQGSRAEIGIAKSGYVVSRCGWFSDRSACYLASGRPIVAQDTGWSRFLPAGAGALDFVDEEGAAAAIDEVQRDYDRHARCARELAHEYLDSAVVLRRLLEHVGA